MKFSLLLAILVSGMLLSPRGADAAVIAYWNFGDAIAENAVVAASYGATTVAPGISVSNIQFESGWTVVNQQVNRTVGSTSLTIGSQTFDSDSTGTYAAIIDDQFTRFGTRLGNEGDNRNNANPGGGMLQLLTPGNNLSDVAESRALNLGFGFTVGAVNSTLNLSSVVLQAARFNNNPERSWERISLFANTGSGQFLVGTSGVTPLSPTLAPVTFNLASLASIADGNSVSFRFYGDNGTGGDNAFGRELWIDDITLNGSITAVPEPSSFALMGIGLGATYLARRRKLKAGASTAGC